jgi:hypothetical protein
LRDVERSQLNASQYIPLQQSMDTSRKVKETFKNLVLSVEYCNAKKSFCQQPDKHYRFTGALNIEKFPPLHTLEMPVPFSGGSPAFSVDTPFKTYLPPNIRRVYLRMNMSRIVLGSQIYRWYTLHSTKVQRRIDEMDVGYMLHVSLYILNYLPHSKSILVG